MTKMGEKCNTYMVVIFYTLKKDVHFLGSRRRLQRALQTRCFFVFVLFLGTILTCLDLDLDLQTPLNLCPFWIWLWICIII
jgi:hypothetical protein